MSDNLLIIKVVETVVTTYVVRGDINAELALKVVELQHMGQTPATNCSIEKQVVDTQLKVKLEYQKNNDRPKDKPCSACTPTWKCQACYKKAKA